MVHYVKYSTNPSIKELLRDGKTSSSINKSFSNFRQPLVPRHELHCLRTSWTSMMQQFSAKAFSLNVFHTLTYPFLILFRPKRMVPFMKNVWLGIYHYGNHSFTVVSFFLKHTFHLKACRLSQGQHFPIHYYFAQTVISTGNLHLAGACVCHGNRNQTPVCAVGGFFFPSPTTATKQPGISKAAEWKSLRVE